MDLELEMEVTRSFSSVLHSLFSIFLGSTHKAALARSRPILPLHLLSHGPRQIKVGGQNPELSHLEFLMFGTTFPITHVFPVAFCSCSIDF